MKKLACVFLAFCMLLCAAYAGAEDSAAAEKKTFPLYYERGGEEPTDPAFPLYFIGGVDDLPYADIRDIVDLANRVKDVRGFSGLTWLIECDGETGVAGILTEGSSRNGKRVILMGKEL